MDDCNRIRDVPIKKRKTNNKTKKKQYDQNKTKKCKKNLLNYNINFNTVLILFFVCKYV